MDQLPLLRLFLLVLRGGGCTSALLRHRFGSELGGTGVLVRLNGWSELFPGRRVQIVGRWLRAELRLRLGVVERREWRGVDIGASSLERRGRVRRRAGWRGREGGEKIGCRGGRRRRSGQRVGRGDGEAKHATEEESDGQRDCDSAQQQLGKLLPERQDGSSRARHSESGGCALDHRGARGRHSGSRNAVRRHRSLSEVGRGLGQDSNGLRSGLCVLLLRLLVLLHVERRRLR